MAIEGKVAAILNERELIINRGAEAGVKERMKFRVRPRQDLVKDPDTGKDLLTIPREQIRVQIVQVEPDYSIGRTYETYVTKATPAPLSELAVSLPTHEVTRVRTFRYPSDDVIFGPFEDGNSVVHVGDEVEEVEEELRKPN